MIRKLLVILGSIGGVLATVTVFAIVIGTLAANRPQPERGEPQSFDPTVFVDTVQYRPTRLTVFAQGEVRPKQEINLVAQVGGKIVDVSSAFADGGVIRQGQRLVKIEDTDYRLAVTRAQAQVASAKTALDIERAESELAEKDFEELSRTGDVTASALTLRQPQLARAQADYDAALANLRDAQLALERTNIRAPFDGRVRSIQANVGQFISAGVQLGRIFSTDVAEVRLPLTDADLARLNLSLAFNDRETGPEVMLSSVVAGVEREWKGRLVRVDASVDPSTRQVGAIAQVDDPYGAGADDGFPFAVGLFVDAVIQGPMLDRAVTLPRVAVQNGMVYSVDDENVVIEHPVDVAAFTADGAIITGGIDDGQTVIVSRLAVPVGSKVRPLTTGGSAAGTDAVADESNDTDGTVTAADANAGPDSSGSALR